MDANIDEEVLVESVDYDDYDSHPDAEQPPPPHFNDESWYSKILHVVEENGWYLLLILICALFVWNKLQPKFYIWWKKREEDAEAATYHKDPDLVRVRHEAMESARRRLQQEHDLKAAEYAEKVKQREEMKRQAKIEDWQRYQDGKGYRSRRRAEESGAAAAAAANSSVARSKKPRLRPEYNPLMGSSGGSYRPNRSGGGMDGGG